MTAVLITTVLPLVVGGAGVSVGLRLLQRDRVADDAATEEKYGQVLAPARALEKSRNADSIDTQQFAGPVPAPARHRAGRHALVPVVPGWSPATSGRYAARRPVDTRPYTRGGAR